MPNIEFNPATLLLLAVLGAAFGATSTVATYCAFRVAKEVGEEMAPKEARIKLPIPTGELKRLPLPYEVLLKLLAPAP